MIYDFKWKINKIQNEVDTDLINFVIYCDDCLCGKAEIELLYDSYDYEFISVLTKKEFENEFSKDPIVKILLLEIQPEYRSNGMARYLLSNIIDSLRNEGYNQWFLNASPLDINGLSLEQLENFYGQLGFHKKQPRDKSTLMWFKDKNKT